LEAEFTVGKLAMNKPEHSQLLSNRADKSSQKYMSD